MVSEFFQFLRQPTLDLTFPENSKDKFRCLLMLYLFCMCFTVFFGFVAYLISQFDPVAVQSGMNAGKMPIRLRGKTFLLVGFFAPLYEEYIFRYYLRLERKAVAVSFSLMLLGGGAILLHHTVTTGWIIGFFSVVILGFLGLRYVVHESFLKKTGEKHFGFLFYSSVVLFGIYHLTIFLPFRADLFYLYPLFIIPQIALALGTGYIRLRLEEGIYWAVLLHVLVNISGLLVNVLFFYG